MATIFAIFKTSCDETAAAIVKNRQVCSNVVASQIKIHEQFGGVVPEVASRSHLEMLNQVIAQCLGEANLSWSEIDGIAALRPRLKRCIVSRADSGEKLGNSPSKTFFRRPPPRRGHLRS